MHSNSGAAKPQQDLEKSFFPKIAFHSSTGCLDGHAHSDTSRHRPFYQQRHPDKDSQEAGV